MEYYSNEERLSRLGWFSSEQTRPRGDLIEELKKQEKPRYENEQVRSTHFDRVVDIQGSI